MPPIHGHIWCVMGAGQGELNRCRTATSDDHVKEKVPVGIECSVNFALLLQISVACEDLVGGYAIALPTRCTR